MTVTLAREYTIRLYLTLIEYTRARSTVTRATDEGVSLTRSDVLCVRGAPSKSVVLCVSHLDCCLQHAQCVVQGSLCLVKDVCGGATQHDGTRLAQRNTCHENTHTDTNIHAISSKVAKVAKAHTHIQKTRRDRSCEYRDGDRRPWSDEGGGVAR